MHGLKGYPDAGHGFLNDHQATRDKTPVPFTLIGRLMPGAGYHEPRRRTSGCTDRRLLRSALRPWLSWRGACWDEPA